MALHAYLATVMAAALFAAPPSDATTNPSLSVNPDPLTQGGSATVSYSDPSKAGESVTVDIDNGSRRNPETTSVVIELDANGEGTVIWQVPNWSQANFNAPGAAEVGVPVVESGEDQ